MKKDVHYGVIPGTKKPTLYKAGSEQILNMFQIAIEPIVEDLSTEDECRIRVICRLTSIPSGRYLGSGVGEASSSEQKYMWRKIVSKAEWEWYQKNKPESTRIRFFSYWDNGRRQEGEEQQVRAHVPDIRNTILKMAKKRAQMDGTLTVTGCSDCFDQDLEDLPEEIQSQVAEQQQHRQAPEPIKPTVKKVSAVTSGVGSGKQAEVSDSPKPQPVSGDVEYASDAQRKRLWALMKEVAMPEDMLRGYLAQHGIHSTKAIPKTEYEAVCKYVEEFGKSEKEQNKEF